MEIFKQIKTYEDALKALDKEDFCYENLYPREIARRKLEIVIEALNEGWKPDWNNHLEKKWYPYFYGLHANLSCSYSLYSPSRSDAYVGCRLYCKSEEIADYVGQKFIYLYKRMILG